MSDTRQNTDDEEHGLLQPTPTAVEAYLSRLEELGFDIETAVVKQPSEQSSGMLTVQFWRDEHTSDDQEGER